MKIWSTRVFIREKIDCVTVLNLKCTSRLSCIVDTILSLIDLPVCLQDLYFSVVLFYLFYFLVVKKYIAVKD
jgi:isoprenylcysteine carboxyl methyltransferase (ICMT) family protein YpbQ